MYYKAPLHKCRGSAIGGRYRFGCPPPPVKSAGIVELLIFSLLHSELFYGTWCDDDSGDSNILERRIDSIKSKISKKLELTQTQKVALDRMMEDIKEKHAKIKAHHPEIKTQLIDAMRKEELAAEDIAEIIESKRSDFDALLVTISQHIYDQS